MSDLESVVSDASDEPVSAPEEPPRRPRSPVAFWLLGGLVLVLIIGSIIMSAVPLPYYTISPGDAVDVGEKVSVRGHRFEPDGDLMLLFVRQRARINGWEWIRATLDSDIDLYSEKNYTGGRSPQDVQSQAVADMAGSQLNAKIVAFKKLGYEVRSLPGLDVLAVLHDRPANGVLQPGDVIVEVEGKRVSSPTELQRALRTIGAGHTAHLMVQRKGEEIAERVGLVQDPQLKRAVMGVNVSKRYGFPFDVTIDTADIGGPSAGLAMTLSVLDALSPADLIKGHKIAATGEIWPDGTVHDVGGVGQKTVSARANGAQLMIVPEDEVREARARAKGLKIVGVSNVDDALRALEQLGGDHLVRPAATRTDTQTKAA